MSPSPTAATTPATPRRRSRLVWLSAGMVLLVLAALVAAAAAIFWAAGTESGSAWLLTRGPLASLGVEVIEPQGTLIGDLKARRVTVSAGRTRVVIEQPAWRALSVSYAPEPSTWLSLHAQSLHAERVVVSVSGPPSGKPFVLPTQLHLPLHISVDSVQVGELLVPGMQDRPMRDVRAQVQLGAEHGRQHVFNALSVRLEPLHLSGHARIGTQAPLALDVQVQAVQSQSAAPGATALPPWAKAVSPDWQAQLQASGPLARFQAQASLRAQGQSLAATAQVAPTERWPLPQLEATTQGLDLSALLAHAPVTALSGSLRISPAGPAPSGTLTAQARLTNAKPGRWDAQQLPLSSLSIDASAPAQRADQLELSHFSASFSDGHSDAGSLKGRAHWKAGDYLLFTELSGVQPGSLDARLAAMTLSGPLSLSGHTSPAGPAPSPAPSPAPARPHFKATVDLSGRLMNERPQRALSRPVQLKLDITGTDQRIELKSLRAGADAAYATLSGTATRAGAAWQIKGHASLADFDPRPWFPAGPAGGWQAGAQSLSLEGDLALNVPDALVPAGSPDPRSLHERLASLRGEAQVKLKPSVLAGVPLLGHVALRHAGSTDPLHAQASLDVAGNRIQLDGQLTPDTVGAKDRWALEAQAPDLARLTPLLRQLLPPGPRAELLGKLRGSLEAQAQASGRWPALASQGHAKLSSLRVGDWSLGQGQVRWQAGTEDDAPLDVQLDLTEAVWGQRQLGSTSVQLKGSPRNHDFKLRTELKDAPPAWLDKLQGRDASTSLTSASLTTTTPPGQAKRIVLQASAHGSLSGLAAAPAPWGWKGVLQQLDMRSTPGGATPLLTTQDIGLELFGGPATRATITAGRAEIVGAGLRWNRIDWQAGQGAQTQALDMRAELEPLAVAPLLRRAQPAFGWGGDLQVAGKVVLHQAETFSADIVFERLHGDLHVTEEGGVQPLGLTDLRIGLAAQDGVWSFTAGLAGEHLGVLGGAAVLRTSPQLAWPAPEATLQGGLEARVANLGTWGAWVPPGWRLDGQLNVSAGLGGQFKAPEYTGQVKGSGIGVRNMLEGISVTDGEVDISLQGSTARINTFTARGGEGSVRLEGQAQLDDRWRTHLKLVADKFQLLGRVDARIVTSGQAEVSLDADSMKANGRFRVDEGLIDFTRISSPSLGDDVLVTGRATDPEERPPAPTPGNRVALDFTLNMGDKLRVRGKGLDTLLAGELHVSRPGGKWHLVGAVNAVNGTFNSWGQKLDIDHGTLSFNGDPATVRLDLEAIRPNLDVRVGVQAKGPLTDLRVRLISNPEMSINEKMSWLILGRASDGLGKTDIAMVQQAALAVLAGDGGGGAGDFTRAIGIDDVSVRSTDGDNKETVVAVGKQVSKRVYIAYEQNLNTSAGSFQVIYRIAQRFVMRLQSGLDRSVDLIGTWRWD